ncbi:MAG TPA: histidine kinase dimerization/phospho-acceptor domain-containing protein [Thermoanaerobaculia bacterium]
MRSRKAGDSGGEGEAQRNEALADLAMEINQPLAAIRINAQAALRFLDGSNPDLDEVRAALREIVEDDERAAAAVRRLQALPPETPEPPEDREA